VADFLPERALTFVPLLFLFSEPNGTEVAAAGQHKHIDQSSKVYNLLKVLLNVFNYHVPALSSSPAASGKYLSCSHVSITANLTL
jgi:hypothetical protein